MEAISVYFILLLLYLLYLRLGTQKQLVTFEKPIQSLHELLEKSYPIQCSPSVYEYLDVLDENADSRDTMIGVMTRLHHEFYIGDSRDHLIVAGDAKTYQHLQEIKREYGEQLSWLIPFPGDFHILINYQPVLSKVWEALYLEMLDKFLLENNEANIVVGSEQDQNP